MAKTTQATMMLKKAGVSFVAHEYEFDHDTHKIGLAAAEAIGIPTERVLKTLMVLADGKPGCCVIPVDHELSMKKAAHVLGAKSAEMMKPADAERLTGYHVGGISPFGQRKRVPVAIEASVMDFSSVYINGGQRGMMVELAPKDAVTTLSAKSADLIA